MRGMMRGGVIFCCMPNPESSKLLLRTGMELPEVAWRTSAGAEIKLSELVRGGRVAFIFYRGAW